jgi:hypothetical protein
MNERIRELMDEADEVVSKEYDDLWGPIWAEKFAELIVKECAKIAIDNDITDTGTSSDAIKKHFGVE